tara:strand:+ start:1042 stop:1395 length:354 start_codon:yes stop_codon:yes gene_type:complete
MYENSYNSLNSYTDKGLLVKIGEYIRHQRLQQNKTQAQIAKNAGISRSTLSLLEHGESGTIGTLIQVLRALDLLEILSIFSIKKELSPMALAKAQEKERQRASSGNIAAEPDSEWEW